MVFKRWGGGHSEEGDPLSEGSKGGNILQNRKQTPGTRSEQTGVERGKDGVGRQAATVSSLESQAEVLLLFVHLSVCFYCTL